MLRDVLKLGFRISLFFCIFTENHKISASKQEKNNQNVHFYGK